jgi:hypothetical protein
MQTPKTLGPALVVRYARVTETVRPTGKTRHFRGDVLPAAGEPLGGTLIPPAKALAIAQYPDENSFYLFGLDDQGDVQSDTWHETLEDALSQADFEYEGLVWTVPSV